MRAVDPVLLLLWAYQCHNDNIAPRELNQKTGYVQTLSISLYIDLQPVCRGNGCVATFTGYRRRLYAF